MIGMLIIGAILLPQLLFWAAKFIALDIWGIYQDMKALRQKGSL